MAAGTFRTEIPEGNAWTAVVAGPIKLVVRVPLGGRSVSLYVGATASPPTNSSDFWQQDEDDVAVSMVLNATDTLWARSPSQPALVVRMQTD